MRYYLENSSNLGLIAMAVVNSVSRFSLDGVYQRFCELDISPHKS